MSTAPVPVMRPPSNGRIIRRLWLPGCVGLILLAALLRFHLLGAQSLWNDEGSSYVQATRSLGEIAENAGRDIHPPGYYWLLHIWLRLTGDSEFALRSLSALAGVLTVAFTAALGLRLFGRAAGLLAAGLVALNTFNIYYSQEARMYALLALWGVAAMWAFAGLLGGLRPRRASLRRKVAGYALALAAFNTAGMYTQYAYVYVLLTQGVVFGIWWIAPVIAQRGMDGMRALVQPLLAFVAVNLLLLLLYLPWLPTAWEQVTTWPSTGEPVGPLVAIAELLAYFGFGITVGTGTTIAVVFFLLFALVQLPEERGGESWWQVLLPVAWVLASTGVFLAMDLYRPANIKFLLPAQIGFAVWLARGVWVLWHIRPRGQSWKTQAVPKAAAAVGVLSIVLTLWGGLTPLYTDEGYRRDDYRAIVAVIEAAPHATDAIILNAPGQQEVFGYYYSGDATVYPIPRGYGGDDAATLVETRAIIAQYARIYAVLWGTDERDPNRVVERTLDAEAYEADSTWYGDVRLVRYVAPVDFDQLTGTDARFGEHIRLLRYGLSSRSVQPGDVLQVQLHWQTDTPLDTSYSVFVQLLNPDGTLALQRDAQPAGGTRPTTTWEPGETVIDNHALIIPNDLPLANYALIIGLYNSDDPAARLPMDNQASTDFLTLGQVTVE